MSGYFSASATATDAPHECPRTVAVGNVEFCECLLDQFGLGVGGPDHIARAVAVTETGSVENDDPEMFCRKINQTAAIKVFNN